MVREGESIVDQGLHVHHARPQDRLTEVGEVEEGAEFEDPARAVLSQGVGDDDERDAFSLQEIASSVMEHTDAAELSQLEEALEVGPATMSCR